VSLEVRPARAQNGVAILGVFVADLAFSADRLPILGETLKGAGFQIGPGGKGSNQAVAAARAGADVSFITRLGRDTFGAMARKLWSDDGIAAYVTETDTPTGAAFVYVNSSSGENAIIIVPGAAAELTADDVEAAEAVIAASKIFVTQLEQPVGGAKGPGDCARARRDNGVQSSASGEDSGRHLSALRFYRAK
jgi:ribokinase